MSNKEIYDKPLSKYTANMKSLKQQPHAGGWMPIDTCNYNNEQDILITDGEKVLTAWKETDGLFYCYRGGIGYERCDIKPTHWQPLPAPPGTPPHPDGGGDMEVKLFNTHDGNIHVSIDGIVVITEVEGGVISHHYYHKINTTTEEA